MSLDALFPCGGDNAIKNAIFAIEWREHITGKDAQEIKTRMQQRLQHYSVYKPHQTMVVNFTPASVSPVSNVSATETGFVAETKTLVGSPPRRVISIIPDQAMIQFNEYSRWKQIKEEVNHFLAAVVGAAGGMDRPLASVGMQYTDEFNWRADPAQLTPDLLFNKGAPFLPPNVFGLTSYWHANHGYYTTSSFDQPQLINVNISRNDVNGMNVVQVITSHKIKFDKPQWVEAEAKIKLIGEMYESFHADNKSILKRLLRPEICEKIKLT